MIIRSVDEKKKNIVGGTRSDKKKKKKHGIIFEKSDFKRHDKIGPREPENDSRFR